MTDRTIETTEFYRDGSKCYIYTDGTTEYVPAEENTVTEHDPVNHPKHYASEAKCSGCGEPIEAIDVIRHLGFNIGNSIKYLWRAGKKDDIVQDLRKAIWYIEDQIAMLEGRKNPKVHRLNAEAHINAKKAEMFADAVAAVDAQAGVKIINHPECKFGESEKLSGDSFRVSSYKFECETHKFAMFMPIDKAPEHCSKYETETE